MTNTIIVAFKNKSDAKGWESFIEANTISIGLKSEWMHCELLFPNHDYVAFSAYRIGGVQFREPTRSIHDPSKWEFYLIPVREPEALLLWCASQVGKPYDLTKAFALVFEKLGTKPRKGWFCSEICYYALKQVDGVSNLAYTDAEKLSPNQFRLLIQESGYKPVSLSEALRLTSN